jgi:hypothetical protein
MTISSKWQYRPRNEDPFGQSDLDVNLTQKESHISCYSMRKSWEGAGVRELRTVDLQLDQASDRQRGTPFDWITRSKENELASVCLCFFHRKSTYRLLSENGKYGVRGNGFFVRDTTGFLSLLITSDFFLDLWACFSWFEIVVPENDQPSMRNSISNC